MKRQFQIIHFVPNPVTGARVPMGAIVWEGRSVRIARAAHLPGAECLGGRESARLLNFLVDDLRTLEHAEQIYQRLGPQVFADETRPVPRDVEDAVAWLERHVLPRADKVTQDTPSPRRPSRYAEGKRFLEKHEVGGYVRRSFNPQRHLGNVGESLQHLGSVSQWVAGDGRLLLMEPLVPRRPEWEQDLTKINTTFSAYRYHVRNGLNGHEGELIAYILPGGADRQRREMRRTLQAATNVVDTDSPTQLATFIEHVRTTGESQSELDI
jgi:hypothetical protein